MDDSMFQRILIIGVGLIGSSIARSVKKLNLSKEIYGLDSNANVLQTSTQLQILTESKKNIEDYNIQFDLIIICSPVGTYQEIFSSLNKL